MFYQKFRMDSQFHESKLHFEYYDHLIFGALLFLYTQQQYIEAVRIYKQTGKRH